MRGAKHGLATREGLGDWNPCAADGGWSPSSPLAGLRSDPGGGFLTTSMAGGDGSLVPPERDLDGEETVISTLGACAPWFPSHVRGDTVDGMLSGDPGRVGRRYI